MPWDSIQIIVAVLVTLAVFVGFLRDWGKPEVVALGGLVVLILFGMVGSESIGRIFSNPAPLTIGSMFVLSAALERTGVMERLALAFSRAAGRSLPQAIGVLALIVIPLSAFTNNTPVVVVFLPILIAYSRSSGLPASKLLIPLSFLAILGGTMTLLGTSTNLLASGIAVSNGMEPFGIFEITKLGACFAVIGTVYLLFIAPRLLPDRPTLSSLLSAEDTRSFCSQAVIAEGSSLIGKTLPQTALGRSKTIRVFEVIRDGVRVSDTPIDSLMLAPGDILTLKGSARDIAGIGEDGDLFYDTHRRGDGSTREVQMAEVIIGPHSPMVGRTVRGLGLRRRYGVVAAAIHRSGQNLLESFMDIPLEFGDTVLLEGPEANLAKLRDEDNFLALNFSRAKAFKKALAPVAIGILALVVAASALGLLSIEVAALAGAIGVVLIGCVTPEEAVKSIEWPILFLIIAMLGIGGALESSGAAALMAGSIADTVGPAGPWVLLAIVYLLCVVLTELVTNNAVAIIMTPLVIDIAMELGYGPRPFVVAVMFAASASFCTPIGYQTNTYVFGAGGYRFQDFFRTGFLLSILLFVTAVVLIPVFWPF